MGINIMNGLNTALLATGADAGLDAYSTLIRIGRRLLSFWLLRRLGGAAGAGILGKYEMRCRCGQCKH